MHDIRRSEIMLRQSDGTSSLITSIPPAVAATWPKPNLIDPPDRGDGLLITLMTLGVCAIVVLGMRVHSRIYITRTLGIDDYLAMLSLVFTLALSITAIIAVRRLDLGHHVWDVDPDFVEPQRLNLWISTWFYYIASLSIKVSVLLFYRRLAIPFSRTFKYAIWAGIIFNITYTLVGIIQVLFVCAPVQSYWLAYNHEWAADHTFKCGNESAYLIAAVSLSLAGDLYSTLLPIVLILTLNLPNTRKGPLFALFGVGFFVVGAGIARATILARLVTSSWDFTWTICHFWLWTIIELYAAIIAASMPALKAWYSRFAKPNIQQSLNKSTKMSQGTTAVGSMKHSISSWKAKSFSAASGKGMDYNELPDLSKLEVTVASKEFQDDGEGSSTSSHSDVERNARTNVT